MVIKIFNLQYIFNFYISCLKKKDIKTLNLKYIIDIYKVFLKRNIKFFNL